MAHIFISYSTQNRDYVLKLADRLGAEGFDAWIGNRNDPGDKWWRPTARAIKESLAFIVIMTPEALASELVQLEVSLAVGYEKPMLPLLLAGEVWETFKGTPYEDVRKGDLPSEKFFEKLKQQTRR